ncbi:MAG: hypothetical protein AB7E36_12200 [Salinivirgaceae bacterium]
MKNWFYNYSIKQKYRNDQQGIMRRYLRESKQWEVHLKQTQSFILSCLEGKEFNRVAVLGSGWLLDVPVVELLNHSKELHLFDAVHPKQVVHKYKSNKTLIFVKKDLSFGLIHEAANCKNSAEFMSALTALEPDAQFTGYDLVISVNLLNQLDNLLIEFLRLRFSLSLEQEEQIRQNVQDNHIKSMPKGKSCLISDWFEVSEKVTSGIVSEKQLVYSRLLEVEHYQGWDWVFDTHKMYRIKTKTTFKVRAYKF